jgi:hypothetical protein
MLVASYVAGAILLAILPLAFFVARHLAKRSKSLPWSIDDTLLVFSLVGNTTITDRASLNLIIVVSMHRRGNLLRWQDHVFSLSTIRRG